MLLFVFYYCIFFFLCRCHSFNPSLCHLSVPFLLSYVTVSRSCRLSEFDPNKASNDCYVKVAACIQ